MRYFSEKENYMISFWPSVEWKNIFGPTLLLWVFAQAQGVKEWDASSLFFIQVNPSLHKAAGCPIDLPTTSLSVTSPDLNLAQESSLANCFQNNDLGCNLLKSVNVQKQLFIIYLINTHQLATVWQKLWKTHRYMLIKADLISFPQESIEKIAISVARVFLGL